MNPTIVLSVSFVYNHKNCYAFKVLSVSLVYNHKNCYAFKVLSVSLVYNHKNCYAFIPYIVPAVFQFIHMLQLTTLLLVYMMSDQISSDTVAVIIIPQFSERHLTHSSFHIFQFSAFAAISFNPGVVSTVLHSLKALRPPN